MFFNPWCKSYYAMLQEKGLVGKAACGCPSPRELPFVTTVDEGLEAQFMMMSVEKAIVTHPDLVLDVARKNLVAEVDEVNAATLNDLFKSVEQPPYDTVVEYVVVPRKYYGIIDAFGPELVDRDKDKLYLYTATIIPVDYDSDIIAVVGSQWVHGMRVTGGESK